MELAALVAKMMAKEPERRFQTPREVAQALQPFFKKTGAAFKGSQPEVSRVDRSGGNQGTAGANSASTKPVTSKTPVPGSSPEIPVLPAPASANWESLVESQQPQGSSAAQVPVKEPDRRRPGKIWPLVATASGTAALLLGVIIYFVTNTGRIKIDVDDPNAVVLIDGNHVTIEGLGEPIKLSVGEHELRIKRGDSEFRGRKFSIRRGDNKRLVVAELIPPVPTEIPSGKTVRMASGPGEQDQPPTGGGLDGTGSLRGGPDSKDGPDSPAGTASPKRDSVYYGKGHIIKGGGQWQVQGNELVVTRGKIIFPIVMFGDAGWRDYDFTVDAMRTLGGEGFSLIFRSTEQANQLIYMVTGRNNEVGEAQAVEMKNVEVLQKFLVSIASNRWYTARISVRGSHVQGFLNEGTGEGETKLFDFEHSGNRVGRVGLQASWSEYRFRNIKVTSPDGKLLWEGPPEIVPPQPPTGVRRAEPAVPPVVRLEGHFKPLFNGKDLAGWKNVLTNGSEWKVVGGLLAGRGSGQEGCYANLITNRQNYTNFRFHARFRHPQEGHASIEVRLSGGGDNRNGYLVNLGVWPRTDPWQIPVGSITKMRNQRFHHIAWEKRSEPSPVPPGKWNVLEITVARERITTFVNGKQVAEYADATGWYGSGAISLIVTGKSVVEFQEILIEELSNQDSLKTLLRRESTTGKITDALQPGTVWIGEHERIQEKSRETFPVTFTVLKRDGDEFSARYQGANRTFEIRGTIHGTRIGWLAKDVITTKGNQGHDTTGSIQGDEIFLHYSGIAYADGKAVSGTYKLRLKNESTRSGDRDLCLSRRRFQLCLHRVMQAM